MCILLQQIEERSQRFLLNLNHQNQQLTLSQFQGTHHQLLLTTGQGIRSQVMLNHHPNISPLRANMGITLLDIGAPAVLQGVCICQLFVPALAIAQFQAFQAWSQAGNYLLEPRYQQGQVGLTVLIQGSARVREFSRPDGQFLGGRSNGQHFWNGTLKRLRVSSPAIGKEPRIFNEPNHEEGKVSAQLDLDLSSNPEEVLEKKGFRLLSSVAKDAPSPRLEALTALCHAVLTSNEFLYLH